MVFKLNISNKEGKTYKLELGSEGLNGKILGEKVLGNDLNADLSGYEFIITGASDKAGFTAMSKVPGMGLKKVLLSYEKGMKKRPKREGKKKRSNYRPKGLKLRKTVRGNTISEAITQINLKVEKEGSKRLSEIFSDQNISKEEPKNEVTEAKEEAYTETPK